MLRLICALTALILTLPQTTLAQDDGWTELLGLRAEVTRLHGAYSACDRAAAKHLRVPPATWGDDDAWSEVHALKAHMRLLQKKLSSCQASRAK